MGLFLLPHFTPVAMSGSWECAVPGGSNFVHFFDHQSKRLHAGSSVSQVVSLLCLLCILTCFCEMHLLASILINKEGLWNYHLCWSLSPADQSSLIYSMSHSLSPAIQLLVNQLVDSSCGFEPLPLVKILVKADKNVMVMLLHKQTELVWDIRNTKPCWSIIFYLHTWGKQFLQLCF